MPSRPRVPQPDAAQVLIVEDNGVNQKVLTAMLAGIGYRADVACNGVDALEALDRNRYTGSSWTRRCRIWTGIKRPRSSGP